MIQRLKKFDYERTRQTGSHVRLTRKSLTGDHHITVPLHASLRVGTLNGILTDVASHLEVSKEEVLRQLR